MPFWQELKKALQVSAFLFGTLVSGTGFAAGPECNSRQFDEIGVVDKVYDGDTIRLRDARVVRMIGINTPELSHHDEPAQPFAAEAKQALASLLPSGAEVGLRYELNRYDSHQRTLAHLYSNSGQNLGVTLLEQGLAFAIVVPPNAAHTDCYFAAERAARDANQGIWSTAFYQSRSVSELRKEDTGFQYIEGVVTGIGKGKKNTWLDMGSHFSVRIQTQHLHYFDKLPIDRLLNKRIRVRGWAAFYNGKLRLTIGHPAMMEILNQQ